ncbi:ATP-binding protein [Streptomyces sp. GbtcB6]|uniref:ATP-binding protein n=1 Tax=Streptomyces sp. GbtcB6 TaxID=2824751 RepID=UPI0020C62C6E|nr:ATP-binding protein [Streptomyces sp. GbtcB6]
MEDEEKGGHGEGGGDPEGDASHADGGTTRITVSDDGPGIPPGRYHAMKERFTRGEHTRASGSGLGLALVEQQARLHHGTLRLGRGPAGGLQAVVGIPAEPEPETEAEAGWPGPADA